MGPTNLEQRTLNHVQSDTMVSAVLADLTRALQGTNRGSGLAMEESENDVATRGLLATDYATLNHGQVTWTTLELASTLLTTTPTGGRLSSPQIYGASRPYTASLQWYWARTRDERSHDPIP
ncbi:hypothetical protein TNCV_2554041 [Trichonephila clavipes]|nr:hypothetical protein TNCV_2554041 [Trichonephila clavipes]